MGGAASFRSCCACGGDRFCHRRAAEPGAKWFPRCSPHLAGESRDCRERPANRDRGALRLVSWAGVYLLDELVAGTPLALADLDRAVDLPWPRAARERPAASSLFLRG